MQRFQKRMHSLPRGFCTMRKINEGGYALIATRSG
jgi:hypothetical protein